MGSNSRQWSETMRRRLGLELSREAIEKAVVDEMIARYAREGAPVIDDAVTTVRRLAERWPLGLASSSHRRVIDAALRGMGLTDVFAAVVSSDEVEHGKPAPDVFLETAHRLRVPPSDVVVVEDSLNGLKAAAAAGMTTVLVPNRAVPPTPGSEDLADLVLDRLAELDPAAVDGLSANVHAEREATLRVRRPGS
jgi:HAD superfamily hydrolase (TIGR01509 family)